MDIKKEFEEWYKDNYPDRVEIDFADNCGMVSEKVRSAAFAYLAGAKRSEELLLADPMIWDGRKVWEDVPFGFNFLNISYQDNANNYPMTVRILTRPKPAWVPSVGDKVCWKVYHNYFTGYGEFHHIGDNNLYYIISDGKEVSIPKQFVKPASMENIGKRWGDI